MTNLISNILRWSSNNIKLQWGDIRFTTLACMVFWYVFPHACGSNWTRQMVARAIRNYVK